MWEDPIVNEVRKLRERLAEKHNFDVGVIFADIQKKQKVLGSRLVKLKRPEMAEQAGQAARSGGVS